MNRIRKKILRYVHRKPKGFRTEETLERGIDRTQELDVNEHNNSLLKNLEIETNTVERRSKSLSSSNLIKEVNLVSRETEIEEIDNLTCSSSIIASNNNNRPIEYIKVMKTNSEESFVSIKESEDDLSVERLNSSKTCMENEDTEKKESFKIIRRKDLPVPKTSSRFSLLSMMRQVFGKDLSRISMPICLNEPLSFVQRISEDLEYHNLLEKACNSKYIDERVAYVTVFASSAISSTFLRLSKPFNPLLGETFELTHRGFKFIAEQVMHHPPVAAYYAESDDGSWVYWGTIWSIMSFGPNSLSILPQGTVHLKIKTVDGEEEYSWERPNCIIHNIIFGTTWLEWLGDINVTSNNHGYKGKTSFFTDSNNSHSWDRYNSNLEKAKRSKRRNIVTGSVYNENNQRLFCIEGQSDYEIQISSLNSQSGSYHPYSKSNVVWRCNPHPHDGDNSRNFFLTYMALELNEISDDYNPEKGANMPITDSRFRPDQRLYESGDVDGAQIIKGLLEEKQRKREKNGTSAVPRWFTKGKKLSSSVLNAKHSSVSKDVVEYEWEFTHEYWNYKNSQKFSDLNDIVDIFNIET
ncbi:oxysterol-binding protein 3 [Cryptosporidium ubiquitum]|uniref:Oxysterol-binding protein 3 n=1 Tax=Cryptosporidium ubiquitum TaxID=857276 RepID=A0A1J4MN66_9CRYT|nr:oxysterol-binding protein 3 [Cryptosporidium ubiquitum]OII74476.1 oxysterol-binding protein 3 [Cryptosporidium ubiquitum]